MQKEKKKQKIFPLKGMGIVGGYSNDTTFMLGNVDKLRKIFNKIGLEKIKYRTTKYKGYGRPKKSDYIIIKRCELRDFIASEVLINGFSTKYSYEGAKII